MRVVKFKGGLGNQMFQYAFAKLIQKKTGEEVKLDYSAYGDLKNDSVRVPRVAKFNLSLDAATQNEIDELCKFSHKGNSQSFMYRVKIYAEKTFNKDYIWEASRAYVNPDTILDRHYFDGYWQSFRYVDEIFEQLRTDFTPKASLSEKTLATQEKMLSENSVFIGVRKGDYTTNKKAMNHFGSFSSQYYVDAMDYIAERVEAPVFYVFSNDVEWCKKNIDWGKHNVIYREPEDQTDDFEELMLMASCKHSVIVNSSYHWWGARLNDNNEKIVCCPDKWFFDDKPIDIIPDNWVRIKTK